MKVIICLDYSPYTEKVLQAARLLLGTRVPQPEITVVHIIDMALLSSSKELKHPQVEEEMKGNSLKVFDLAKEYLGEGFRYIEETGLPQEKIDEVLGNTLYDLVVIGTRGRSMLASALMGSVAWHLLHHIKKPLLIVP